ncbi:UNVERIFIED_CONTAM: BTB/POZ and TAZ domain-containing protein 4 [Sesamum angustifolium]|uniref:BTB/POZ and TAZ domain-containing protein 4 n=1 Tax=Sesamum angustifolium TaxID=2727405 RepID=A0AAW2NJJ5_9LAMI
MDCRNKKSPSTLPFPPPLPPDFITRLHHKGLKMTGSKIRRCCVPNVTNASWDRLFDEGYRADITILTNHLRARKVLRLQSSRLCSREKRAEARNKQSPFVELRLRQFAFLSDSCTLPAMPMKDEGICIGIVSAFTRIRCSSAKTTILICHRFILANLKAVCASEAWRDMRDSHPVLEREILESVIHEDAKQKDRMRKTNENKVYVQLYEAMEALVHICRDGCRTIGPHDKVLRDDQAPCQYTACKGLEALIRHFAGCKLRGPGGCIHCKRMWQILELHSRLCAHSDDCRVPLCRNFRQRRKKQSKKEDIRWRILVKKIVRSKSITGGPYFSLESA